MPRVQVFAPRPVVTLQPLYLPPLLAEWVLLVQYASNFPAAVDAGVVQLLVAGPMAAAGPLLARAQEIPISPLWSQVAVQPLPPLPLYFRWALGSPWHFPRNAPSTG